MQAVAGTATDLAEWHSWQQKVRQAVTSMSRCSSPQSARAPHLDPQHLCILLCQLFQLGVHGLAGLAPAGVGSQSAGAPNSSLKLALASACDVSDCHGI